MSAGSTSSTRSKLIKQHQDFLESYGADSTPDERLRWGIQPVRFLKKHLEQERELFKQRLIDDPANTKELEETLALYKQSIPELEAEIARRNKSYATKMGWNLV